MHIQGGSQVNKCLFPIVNFKILLSKEYNFYLYDTVFAIKTYFMSKPVKLLWSGSPCTCQIPYVVSIAQEETLCNASVVYRREEF